jgi:4-amino-4-deoxychorismate lyase
MLQSLTVMPTTASPVRRLDADTALAALRDLRARQPVKYAAFYSSQLGGIVTDPSLMVLPFDDHMVHRGHGIFDTAGLVNGRIYDLEAHLDRFERSAEHSLLRMPASRDELRRIIVATVAASGTRDGAIRYWVSSGTGQPRPGAGGRRRAGLLRDGVSRASSTPSGGTPKGLRVMTTTYPIKPSLYAITKSTNYLPNVLMQMEAKAAGLDNGVFLDADGHVGESSNMNVAFVTADGVLRHPKFDHILSGCTSLRILELAPALIERGLLRPWRCATSRPPRPRPRARWC